MANKIADVVMTYQFLKRLTTPFEQSHAFKYGIIDKDGHKIKDPKTDKEEESYGYFDRLVFNIKKLIEKMPGGKTKTASYAAALYLIKESANLQDREYSTSEIAEGIYKSIEIFEEQCLLEDAPTNATGAAVAGTNGDVTWKRDARTREMKSYLAKYMTNKNKRAHLKTKRDFYRRIGIMI
jgi:hypothetical protein